MPDWRVKASSSSYRPDIDGLRALAVIAVVGFHAEIAEFRGGFAGVDVFFVISGYLITGIILSAIRSETFTFREFYVRRINRIFPALAVVLVATAIAGWFVLFPPEFEALGKHIAAGAAFVSNGVLWSEAGYFDSKNKPLLHLWSLAVEEQFYLVWPAFLFLITRRTWNVRNAILAVAIASFASCVLVAHYADRTLAFYSPFTRLWELLAGALLATTSLSGARPGPSPRSAVGEGAALAGLGMIAGSTIGISTSDPWPGWWTLIPVLGAMLLIGPARGSQLSRLALASRPMVYVGKISYPLYLWHWPLFVFARLVNEGQVSRDGRILIVLVSFGLAALTYEFVEKPIRFGRRKPLYALVLVPAMGVIAVVGVALMQRLAPPRLVHEYAKLITSKEANPIGAEFSRSGEIVSPVLDGDTSRTVALLGDSHATMYWPRLEAVARSKGENAPAVRLLAYGGCAPLPGLDRPGVSWDGLPFRCDAFHRNAIAFVKRPSVKTVVYSAYWDNYFNQGRAFFSGDRARRLIPPSGPMLDSVFRMFEREVAGLVREGKRVFIVLPNPDATANHPDSMLPRRLPGLTPREIHRVADRAGMDRKTAAVRTWLTRIASVTGAGLIDPMLHVCEETNCRTVTPSGRAIYGDDHHFRPWYARDSATFVDVVLDP